MTPASRHHLIPAASSSISHRSKLRVMEHTIARLPHRATTSVYRVSAAARWTTNNDACNSSVRIPSWVFDVFTRHSLALMTTTMTSLLTTLTDQYTASASCCIVMWSPAESYPWYFTTVDLSNSVTSLTLFIEHPRSSVLYIISVDSVCMYRVGQKNRTIFKSVWLLYMMR